MQSIVASLAQVFATGMPTAFSSPVKRADVASRPPAKRGKRGGRAPIHAGPDSLQDMLRAPAASVERLLCYAERTGKLAQIRAELKKVCMHGVVITTSYSGTGALESAASQVLEEVCRTLNMGGARVGVLCCLRLIGGCAALHEAPQAADTAATCIPRCTRPAARHRPRSPPADGERGFGAA